jgi:hypothetical protein
MMMRASRENFRSLRSSREGQSATPSTDEFDEV